MECIDGEHHKHGPRVYDEGLHCPVMKEPGYLQGMQNAFAHIAEHLGEPLTVESYLRVHRIACSHFRSFQETFTMIGQEKVGCLRGRTRILAAKFGARCPMSDEAAHTLSRLDLGIVQRCNDRDSLLCYAVMSEERVHQRFQEFLDQLSSNLRNASTPQEKLRMIAEYHQKMEWLHPVIDGTSRTSLAIMNKLLVENGLHPVLLEYPHRASTLGLADWTAYLQEGLQAWEQAAAGSLPFSGR